MAGFRVSGLRLDSIQHAHPIVQWDLRLCGKVLTDLGIKNRSLHSPHIHVGSLCCVSFMQLGPPMATNTGALFLLYLSDPEDVQDPEHRAVQTKVFGIQPWTPSADLTTALRGTRKDLNPSI